MSASAINRIVGIVRFDGRPVTTCTLAAMASAVAPAPNAEAPCRPRAAALRISGAVGFGWVRPHDSVCEEGMPFPFLHAATGILIAGDLRLYDRQGLFRALGYAQSSASIPDGQLLAEAYLRWGDAFPVRIRGDFALAVWDPRRRALLLARDHLGCAPLFYAREGAGFFFASDLNGLLAARDHTPDLDPEWIAALLVGNQSDLERSPYPNVFRALPAHIHHVGESGVHHRRYWDLDPKVEVALEGDGEYEEAFRAKIEEAVHIRVPDARGAVGAELSGGLDSSTVTAIAFAAARRRGIPFLTFTHVLPDHLLGVLWPYKDERDWAELLRQHSGIELHVPVTADGYDVLESCRRSVRVQAAPPVGGFVILPDALYEQAQASGVTTLFSGFGGDEMVSSPASLALAGWARHGDWRQLWREFRGRGGPEANASRLALLRAWATLGPARWLPGGGGMRRRLLSAGRKASEALLARLPVTPDFAASWSLRDRFMNQFQGLAEASRGDDLRVYERFRILQPNMAARLEAGDCAAGACGMDYRYPLLDVPLVEFFHAIPPEQKWRLGWGRSLFRRSIAGLVPEDLRWRQDKHGAAIPNALSRYRGNDAAIRALLARARARPELGFLDFDRLNHWADAVLGAANGRDPGSAGKIHVGRFKGVLALAAYFELRAEGWRPGRYIAPLALDTGSARPPAKARGGLDPKSA